MKALNVGILLTLFFFGCSGGSDGSGTDGGLSVSADNGSTVVVGDCNVVGNAALQGSTQNNAACAAAQDAEKMLAQSCATCCDLCEGSAGVDALCRQNCVDDLGCQDVIDRAPQCAAVSDSDDTTDDDFDPSTQPNPGIGNPAVS